MFSIFPENGVRLSLNDGSFSGLIKKTGTQADRFSGVS
jgi:hypothetical protein